MALLSALFEASGNSDGLTMTAANSGLNTISGAGGVNSAVIATGAKVHGSFGGRFNTGSSAPNGSFGILNFSSSTNLTFTSSVVVKIPSTLPSITFPVVRIRNASGDVLAVNYSTSGSVTVSDAGGTINTLLTAGQATAGTQFRFQVYGTVGASTTTGNYTAKAYTQSTGIQAGSTVTVSNANMGTTAVNNFRVGVANTVSNMTVDVDDVQINDGTTTPIGDLTTNTTPPTITASANQTISAGGSPVTLTATGTAASGSAGLASYAWTCLDYPAGASAPTISGAATNTATFTPTVNAPGRYRFQVTCTDLEGNVSSAAITKVFYPATLISPLEITGNSGWTISGISTLSDANDGTAAVSGPSGSGGQLVIRLNPLIWPVTGFSLDIRSYVDATGGTQSVQLLEGAVVRKDWGAISPSTSAADTVLSLTSGEIAAITSGNELDVRFTQA